MNDETEITESLENNSENLEGIADEQELLEKEISEHVENAPSIENPDEKEQEKFYEKLSNLLTEQEALKQERHKAVLESLSAIGEGIKWIIQNQESKESKEPESKESKEPESKEPESKESETIQNSETPQEKGEEDHQKTEPETAKLGKKPLKRRWLRASKR